MRQLLLLACIVYTGASIGHVAERAWEICVEKKDAEITLEDAATGWWHWVPTIWNDAPHFQNNCMGTTEE